MATLNTHKDKFVKLVEQTLSRLYPIELFSEEGESYNDLLRNTDRTRLHKSIKNVRRYPPVIKKLPNFTVIHYNVKSKESDERHIGFIKHKHGIIQHLYCSCQDFRNRMWYNLIKAGLSKLALPKRYEKTIPRGYKPPEPVDRKGRLYVCKHLASMKQYVKNK